MQKWHYVLVGAVVVFIISIGAFIVKSSGSVAASVNGVTIPQSEIEKQIEIVKQQQGNIFSSPEGKDLEKQFRATFLDLLINAELIKQEADKQNVTVSKSEIDKKVSQLKKMYGKGFDQALKNQNLTEDDLRKEITKQMIADKMLAKVTKGVEASDKEIKDYYKEHKKEFLEPEQKHWRQLVTKNKSKAEALIQELGEDGDFAALAKKEFIDKNTKDQGGDLGWVSAQSIPTEMEKHLSKVKVGEVSSAIKGPLGWHVFQLQGVKKERQLGFDDVTDQVKEQLNRDIRQKKFSAWVETLKKEAKVSKGN